MAFAKDIALITDAMSKGIAYAVDDAAGGTYVFFDSAKHPSKVLTRSYETTRALQRDPQDYMVWYPCGEAQNGVTSPWGAGQSTVNLRRSRYKMNEEDDAATAT